MLASKNMIGILFDLSEASFLSGHAACQDSPWYLLVQTLEEVWQHY